MTTKTPRINITLDAEKLGMLSRIARNSKKSVSSVARDLISDALELSEDLYLSELSETRAKRGKKRLTHADVWK